MKKSVCIAAFCTLAAFVLIERATTLEFNAGQYAPERHLRFYDEDDPPKAFLGGEQFGFAADEWSGIGRVTLSPGNYGLYKWATMISDRYFLSIGHLRPRAGDEITFWLSNNADDNAIYTVEDSMRLGTDAEPALGWLTTAVSANIRKYPILNIPSSELVGREFYLFGRSSVEEQPFMRLGRNIVNSAPSSPYFLVHSFDDPGIGQDEASGEQGDSGAPRFIIHNGAVTLAGVTATTLASSSLSYYLNSILDNMGEEAELVVTFTPGDMDVDHGVDFDDIAAFALGLSSPSEYETTYGRPATDNGDLDGDNDIDFDDISGFVETLGPRPVPPRTIPGDMDFDGDVDFDDINDFTLALTNPSQYQMAYGAPATTNGDLDKVPPPPMPPDVDFDDLSLFQGILSAQAQLRGDMDFDGDVDFDDIGGFVLAISDIFEYFYLYEHQAWLHGDCDEDGDLDFDDIDDFVDKLY